MKAEKRANKQRKLELDVTLFVSQRVDRIFLRRFERRIQGSGNRSDDGNQRSPHHPTTIHNHLQQWEPMGQPRPRPQAEGNADHNAADGEQNGFS